MKFNDDLSIDQTCVLQAKPAIQEDLIGTRELRKKTSALSIQGKTNLTLAQEIDAAQITPLTESAQSFACDSEEIIVGRPLGLCDLNSEDVRGKGIAIYLPMEVGLVSSSEQFNVFQLSENYKLAKFLILLTRLPDEYKKRDKKFYEDCLNNRDANYRQLIEDLEDAPPAFITTNSVQLLEDHDFTPFSCTINLSKMLASAKTPTASIATTQAGKMESQKTLTSSH